MHLILFFHVNLGLLSSLFPSDFPIETLYTPLLSPIRPKIIGHLFIFHLIAQIFGKKQKSWSCSLCNFLLFYLYSEAKITLYIVLRIAEFPNGLRGSHVGYSAFSGLLLPPPRITICNLKTADRCGESYQQSWSAHTVLGQSLLWTCCDTKYTVSVVAQLYCQQRDVAHHENSMHQLPTEIDLSKSRLPPPHRPAYSATFLADVREDQSIFQEQAAIFCAVSDNEQEWEV